MPTYESSLLALADPTRRAVFELLATGSLAVSEVAAALPVSRPAVSQHLRVLKEAGLVIDHQAGTRRIYRVNPEGLDSLRRWLDSFWDAALADFKKAAEGDADRAGERRDRRDSSTTRGGPQRNGVG